MKARYSREDDVLLLYLSEGRIDHAEESGGVIVHFSPEDRPVLLEVLDASDFVSRLTKLTAHAESGQTLPL